MNCARCIHYAVCPYDAIMHDESRWETKKCVHFVDESKIKKVVRGEWEWFEEWSFNGEIKECDSVGFRCSACKEEPSEYLFFDNPDYPPTFDFCPYCGADMRGDENEL